MRIVVLTDIHANLPALEAVLATATQEGYDQIIHVGDVIGIGPYPAESLDRLLNTPNVDFVMGNHDAWVVDGFPETRPEWMSKGDAFTAFENQLWDAVRVNTHWTHRQLDASIAQVIVDWPYQINHTIAGSRLIFQHYGLARDTTAQKGIFKPFIKQKTPVALDVLFALDGCDLLFYGHDHTLSDVTGKCARYINPGALGINHQPLAQYCLVELQQDSFTVEQRSVPYDDKSLFRAFEARSVPGQLFIVKFFFGKQ